MKVYVEYLANQFALFLRNSDQAFFPFLETFVAAQTLVERSGATQNTPSSGTCTQTPSCQQPVTSRGSDPGRGRRTYREPRETLAQGQAQTLREGD